MVNNSVSLFFEEFGSGTPLLLVHGFPLDHTIWYPMIPFLTSQVRLILPDLRGHGNSPAPGGVYRMAYLAEDLVRLLDSLRLDKVALAGHSMGGYVALAFAKLYPDRLSGFGLVASHSFADSSEKQQARYQQAQDAEKSGISALVENMARSLTPRSELAESLKHLMSKTSVAGVVGSLRGMAEREDLTEMLSTIRVPSIVVAGILDTIIPVTQARMVANNLRSGELVELANSAHMPMMEEPQKTAEALTKIR